MTRPDIDLITAELARTLPNQRFFADKAAELQGIDVLAHDVDVAADDEGPIDLLFIRVRTDQGRAGYLLPVKWGTEVPSGHEHSILVAGDGVLGYDALIDASAITALGRALAADGRLGSMTLKTVEGAPFEVPEAGRAMGVEQSNTSVIYDDAVMCKFFRRVHPGVNADVELLAALSTAGCDSVPHLYGWTELTVEDKTFTTAMLQQFVPNSADGWAMALTSVRDVLRSFDDDIDELGTDFSVESRKLGEAVADVHRTLAAAVPVGERASGEQLVAPMIARLEHVSSVVPQVAKHADAARAVFDRAAASVAAAGVPVQRIHGDLHLGQVLRTPREWLLIDFEGEPSRPWDERRLPDHPLRDVAGMIRSFDYAAHYPLLTGRVNLDLQRPRVRDWANRNISAFLDGYRDSGAADTRAAKAQAALLDAFVLDKAIYECLYEAQNRPGWLQLPLAAVERLLSDDAEPEAPEAGPADSAEAVDID
ncbi:maltokinase N-terminal cap-like domain-containing protein [Corynebacterium sp. 335C]